MEQDIKTFEKTSETEDRRMHISAEQITVKSDSLLKRRHCFGSKVAASCCHNFQRNAALAANDVDSSWRNEIGIIKIEDTVTGK